MEGPVCLDVIFNAFRFDLFLVGNTTIKGGTDLSGIPSGSLKAFLPVKVSDSAKDRADKLDKTIADIKALVSFADDQVVRGAPDDIGKNINSEVDRQKGGTTLRKELAEAVQILNAPDPNNLKDTQADKDRLNRDTPIVRNWISRLEERGVTSRDPTPAKVATDAISQAFLQQSHVVCGNIFNNTATTVFSITNTDFTDTLNDATISTKPSQPANIFTVTCASPVSASAGVEFSTIRNQEFAVIKVPNADGTASVSQYGLVTDSPIHPLPIAIANFRIRDLDDDKRWAVHASFGVSGNIQGQGSGGSSVEFLPGISFSFLRTIFLAMGPHIGQKSELAGGIKVGDTVLPDATTPPTVTKSYTARFGFAITFTKPPS